MKEQKDYSCIELSDLEMLDIDAFATEVSKGYAMDIVYGCVVELEEYKTGAIFKGKEEVDSFAEKFADLFKSQKPEFCLCLRGDFEVRDYYSLDEDAVRQQHARLKEKSKAREEEEALIEISKAREEEEALTQGKAKKSKASV
jgi:hypothetical protein